ncbi:hypothetical protein Rhopal_004645-T1 [Rhodotorula paludigena]|uniref:cDENN domain-containing protein n=1 Tax=Rhodotorula paludigena TaxID=86838 RepID=A0AAV5GQ47_9BASI|nr:hypothetical protein Rhopal_004645-T1 [Rhodotorula paludigena]
MPLPIADLYARPRSPYLASSSSPPSSRPAISSSPSAPSSLPSVASLDPRSRPPLKRATLSLDPRRDDPFAPAPPPLPGTGDTGSVGIDAGREVPLGGEEWRVSESDERIVADSAKENVEGDDDDATVRRRTSTSSFLRSLTRPLRSSTSSRTSVSGSLFSSKPKNPRRTRSSIQLDRISSPLPPSFSTVPPDPHPERTKGELLSVGEAVERRRSWLVQQQDEGEERAPAEPPQRAATPVHHAQTISFASRLPSSSLRASRTDRGLNRRASLGSLFFPRKQDKDEGCDQAGEAHANVDSVPPTSSRKALKVLGGLVGGGDTKQQGEPHSSPSPTLDDVVGLALTTDAPTRRIVPDNARYSFATTASSTGSLRATTPSLAKDRAPVSSADLRAAHASSASAQTVKGKLRASTTTRAADSPLPDPLVSLYLVGGLSKDPRNWVEADVADEFEATRLDAEGRRWKAEVLGVMSGAKEGDEGEVRRLGREDMEKVQARALKLAFDRDVEVIASPSQPSATTSFFSFTTSRASPASSPRQQQYHCVSLLVWSHCDDTRATAIASLLQQRITKAQLEAEAVKRGARAARAGQRLSKVLLEQLRQNEPAADDAATTTGGAPSETDAGTDGRASFELDDPPPIPVGRFLEHLDRSPLWLPYAIVLVSTSPLYTLLSDAVRLSWARYHSHLASHSLQMERLLNMPVPRPGEVIRVPVSVAEEQKDTFFSAVMPGEIDWTTGVPCSRNFPLWPVFKCLHADNLLTIAELALAPLGRILFLSKHSIMLCLATMAFQTILELRDWKGLVLPTCHARDLKLFLEVGPGADVSDPGPWLLGLPTSPANASLLSSLAPEIVLVDLDSNLVSCARPFPGAVSTGSVRDKARKRFEGVVGTVDRHEVPLELVEAFPGGRFRPFSMVEVAGEAREAERLKPTWQWDEHAVLKELDSILAETPRAGLVGKLLRLKNPRKTVDLDTNLKHIQAVARDHANTFVERRDSLEGEVNKANRRLAVLMNQSAEWQRSFSVFKEFSDKAARESAELKVRLESERREARRLTGQLAADREQQAQLEANLEQVERAREQALHELARVDELRRDLDQQRAFLAQEVQNIVLCADDETSPVFQAVYSRIEALSQRSETSSRPGTALSSRRPSSRLARQPSYLAEYLPKAVAEEYEYDEAFEVLDEEARLDTMRLAFQETFRAISSRLSLALQAAGDFRGTALSNRAQPHASSSIGTISPSRTAESDATLVSQGTTPVGCRTPLSPDAGPFDGKTRPLSPTGSSALGFQPKLLTLTPPVSPELDDLATPASSAI